MGRVMQKVGMRYEGTLRQKVRKWSRFEDAVMYGLLAAEWRFPPELRAWPPWPVIIKDVIDTEKTLTSMTDE